MPSWVFALLRVLAASSFLVIITGPLTHSVGGQTSNGRGRLSSSSSVTLHSGPASGGQTMTPCGLRYNYSSTAARRASCVKSR